MFQVIRFSIKKKRKNKLIEKLKNDIQEMSSKMELLQKRQRVAKISKVPAITKQLQSIKKKKPKGKKPKGKKTQG